MPFLLDTEAGLAGLAIVVAVASLLLMRWTSRRPRLRILSWLFLYIAGGAVFVAGLLVIALVVIYVVGFPP